MVVSRVAIDLVFSFRGGIYHLWHRIQMWAVVPGPAISGMGGAGTMTISSVIITDIIPRREVASWRAYVNIAMTLGRSFGGPVGGWLSDMIGWRCSSWWLDWWPPSRTSSSYARLSINLCCQWEQLSKRTTTQRVLSASSPWYPVGHLYQADSAMSIHRYAGVNFNLFTSAHVLNMAA
ncbi:hypothetical protein BJX99DRAFT_151292 [Aspergillus californicus]